MIKSQNPIHTHKITSIKTNLYPNKAHSFKSFITQIVNWMEYNYGNENLWKIFDLCCK